MRLSVFLAELREERGAVWGACRGAARGCGLERDGGAGEEPAVGAAALGDLEPAGARGAFGTLSRMLFCSAPSDVHPALQMALILNDEALFEEWKQDIKTMAHRIIDMRDELYKLLKDEFKTPGTWDHIVKQIGMFR